MTTIRMNGFALGILLCVSPGFGSVSAQDPQEVGKTSPGESFEVAQVLYSQSYLDLAKHELKMAEAISSSLSPGALDRRRKNVKIAEEQLRLAKLPPNENDNVPLRLRYAEENAKSAKRSYLDAVASKNAYTESQVEQFRLKAEVAKRRLTVMSNPVQLMSLFDHMHWEIDRLNEDIIALLTRVEELEKRR